MFTLCILTFLSFGENLSVCLLLKGLDWSLETGKLLQSHIILPSPLPISNGLPVVVVAVVVVVEPPHPSYSHIAPGLCINLFAGLDIST